MKFNKEEIKILNSIGIPADEREYSTEELFSFLDVKELEDYKDLHNSIRENAHHAGKKNLPKKIVKEYVSKKDIKECPICRGYLKLHEDYNGREYYNCDQCTYISYIVKTENVTKLKVGDYVRLKGFKNEGKIVEVLNDSECMVEWDDVKMMRELVCGTLYFEFLEKIERGEANPTHLKATKMIELEKID